MGAFVWLFEFKAVSLSSNIFLNVGYHDHERRLGSNNELLRIHNMDTTVIFSPATARTIM